MGGNCNSESPRRPTGFLGERLETLSLHAAAFLAFFTLIVGLNVFNKPLLLLLCLMAAPSLFVEEVRARFFAFFKNPYLVALMFVVIASPAWSKLPKLSASLVVVQASFVALMLVFSAGISLAKLHRILVAAVCLHLLIVVLFIALFPSRSVSSTGLAAYYHHKNVLGALLSVELIILVSAISFSRAAMWFACLAAVLLVMSMSKTSVFGVSVAFMFYYIANPFRVYGAAVARHRYSLIFPVVASMLLLFADPLLKWLYDVIPDDLFTGRGTLWKMVLLGVRSSPYFGIGPGVFWQASRESEAAQFSAYWQDEYWLQRLVASDGAYIDLIASFGVVGFVLVAGLLSHTLVNMIRLSSPDVRRLLVPSLVFCIIHAVTESTILYSTNVNWALMIVAVGYVSQLRSVPATHD